MDQAKQPTGGVPPVSSADGELTKTVHESTVPQAPQTLPPFPETWGHLRILELVGHGGFGEVYRAWDPTLEREVALKLLRRSKGENANLKAEGRLLAKLRHANIVTVYGVAEHDGRIGLWEEFIRGRTLSQLIKEQGPFGAFEALAIGKEVCRALAAVHAAGQIHRDVKAHNVMREDGGRIVLMDFGLGIDSRRAQLSESASTSGAAGTPLYMPPELLSGERATVQSDIYAVGVLLYYLVTGLYPTKGRTWAEVQSSHKTGQHVLLSDVRPDLPDRFVQVVGRALAPKPEDRYQTAGALLQALAEVEAGSQYEPPRAPRGKLTIAALVIAVLVLGVAAGLLFKRLSESGLSGIANQASIVVLPFTNFSADPQNEYLADGLAEELINDLTKSDSLRVVARTSALQFKGPNPNFQKVSQQLKVRFILTGSLRRQGDTLRVGANLVRASDSTQIWSDVYEYKLQDVFAVEQQISKAVASALQIKLGQARPIKAEDPQAHDLYLKGRFEYNKGSPSSFERAIEYYTKALAQDPNYAYAYAGLSRAYARLATMTVPRADVIAKATEAANKAMAIDPRLAEAHTSLGFIKQLYDWDWAGAEKEFRIAIQCNPRDSDPRFFYAGLLLDLLRLQESLEQIAEAEKVDPLSPMVPWYRSAVLDMEGRDQDAERDIKKALADAPEEPSARSLLGLIECKLGKKEEGIAELRHAMDIAHSAWINSMLGWAYGQAGHEAEARRILAELQNDLDRGAASPTQIANVYTGLGDVDNAFKWLDRAVEVHDPGLVRMKMSSTLAPIRKDPRFKTYLTRVGLPQ
jgi:serine/threonine protein kinase/Tfp pilus assembly protein PilF